jgi:N-methylhydantoinase A
MAYKISVDTGGTFTDVVIADEGGIRVLEKAVTTHSRIFDGMRVALTQGAERLELDLRTLLDRSAILIYGTTWATNAIVTKRTAKTAFLTTQGFPDTLVFREGGKFRPHDFSVDYPEPYVPRRYTFEIPERTSSEGEVRLPLDVDAAFTVVQRLKKLGIEAVGVCFLWSVLQPDNELAMGRVLDEHLPNVPVTLSHQLLPIVREYRRASATVIDASLKPLMQKHLREMESDLRASGFHGETLVSTSMGGCMHVEELIERPIHLVKSGPAMAPVAAKTYASVEKSGADVIVCDTGGTTFDVGLIRSGNPVFTRESWIGGQWTGHIVSMSSVDIRSIGAGGGSIAWIDDGGLLRVGPQSAGSEPGPACYRKGGNLPTVTDAAVVLGYLDPDFFLGGRMSLDVEAARRVISHIAKRMHCPIEEAAFAVITLANEHMIRAIQEITTFEGINPQESMIVAGGGAAGLNIVPIARELGCANVILPKTAAALSACGMQFANIVSEYSSSHLTIGDNFDYSGVNETLRDLTKRLDAFAERIKRRGFAEVRYEYYVEARYLFQVWELEVPLKSGCFENEDDLRTMVQSFNDVHRRIFAVVDDFSPVECLNWKARAVIQVTEPASGAALSGNGIAPRPRSERVAYFGAAEGRRTPIYRGESLFLGARIVGPAVIEEQTTSIVVYPGSTATVSAAHNYLLQC